MLRASLCLCLLVACGPADAELDAGDDTGSAIDATGQADAQATDAGEDAGVDASVLDARSPADTSSPLDALTPDVPVAVCGNAIVEEGEECDDGNRDDGDECSAECQHAWACPDLGAPCDDVTPPTVEHRLTAAESCSFALAPWPASQITERRVLIDALVANAAGSGELLSVTDRLNREGRSGISTTNSDRLRNHEWEGFRWNTGDENVDYWYPQGMSGSSDAFATPGARKYVLVSWYNKTEERPTRGARISLADVTDLDNVRYRHLLLVEPSGTPAAPSFGPAETNSGNALHVGGIVWWEDLLYVSSAGGLRVYDLSHVMQATHSDTDRIGVSEGRFDAHGYAFAVPELMRYTRPAGACPLGFSFAGLDRTSDPPAIVTGEYQVDNINGRIVVWDLDPTTGYLEVRGGVSRASAAFVSGQTRMQGAVRYDGNYYISTSSQVGRLGRLYRTRPGFGESSISAWVYGAEDLYIDRERNIIWNAAEHPGNRDVVGIPIRLP